MKKKSFIDFLPKNLKNGVQKIAGFGSSVQIQNSFTSIGYLRPITVSITNTTTSAKTYNVFGSSPLIKVYYQNFMNTIIDGPDSTVLIQSLLAYRPVRVSKVIYEVDDLAQFKNEVYYVQVGLDGAFHQVPFNVNEHRSSDQFQPELLTFKVDWSLGYDSTIVLRIDPGTTVSFTIFPASNQNL